MLCYMLCCFYVIRVCWVNPKTQNTGKIIDDIEATDGGIFRTLDVYSTSWQFKENFVEKDL